MAGKSLFMLEKLRKRPSPYERVAGQCPFHQGKIGVLNIFLPIFLDFQLTIPGGEYIIYAEITGHSTKSVRWSPGQAAFGTETVIFTAMGRRKNAGS